MKPTIDTTIDSLLSAYPFLSEELPRISPQFEKLKNPFLRKTMGKVATVSMAAGLAGMTPEELLRRIMELVDSNAGASAESRREVLKGLIRELHAGKTPDEVKAKFQSLFSGVSATEIAAMEQALIDEGMGAEEITRLCDVHVSVFKDSLEAQDAVEAPSGHPIDTYMRENRELERLLSELNLILGTLGKPPEAGKLAAVKARLSALVESLRGVGRHYERKENQLFPALEAHHFTGPTQVMWSIHDQVRAALKSGAQSVAAGDAPGAVLNLRAASQAMRDMIYKEEHILFPASMIMLSEGEWEEMRSGESAIGFSWIAAPGAGAAAEKPAPEPVCELPGGPVPLDTGSLLPEQINLMLKHLPVDITFVDEKDRVAYYSEGPERIFPRSPGIIGREVRNCHPQKSVHVVNMILDAFKSGEKSEASFWIRMGEKFILIRYFAVRDGAGAYRGCLEVSQEVSSIRALSGERRLLEWS